MTQNNTDITCNYNRERLSPVAMISDFDAGNNTYLGSDNSYVYTNPESVLDVLTQNCNIYGIVFGAQCLANIDHNGTIKAVKVYSLCGESIIYRHLKFNNGTVSAFSNCSGNEIETIEEIMHNKNCTSASEDICEKRIKCIQIYGRHVKGRFNGKCNIVKAISYPVNDDETGTNNALNQLKNLIETNLYNPGIYSKWSINAGSVPYDTIGQFKESVVAVGLEAYHNDEEGIEELNKEFHRLVTNETVPSNVIIYSYVVHDHVCDEEDISASPSSIHTAPTSVYSTVANTIPTSVYSTADNSVKPTVIQHKSHLTQKNNMSLIYILCGAFVVMISIFALLVSSFFVSSLVMYKSDKTKDKEKQQYTSYKQACRKLVNILTCGFLCKGNPSSFDFINMSKISI